MLRLAFDFIIAWREIRARPNAYFCYKYLYRFTGVGRSLHSSERYCLL